MTAVVLLTEWQEFRTLDWGQIADSLAEPVVVDTRNHVDPDVLSRVGIKLVRRRHRAASRRHSAGRRDPMSNPVFGLLPGDRALVVAPHPDDETIGSRARSPGWPPRASRCTCSA
ncbi:UDP binding domain-containing protein [Kutzneria kofuensis]|uniref:UDP binding domain-containing protein n=1 Tax=Kutzneria kofuensis TaxID=103725 RepID=UPI0031EE0525